jgi:hypothetical protein
MNKPFVRYPRVSRLVSEIENAKDTFLSDYDESYGFWPDLEYFLKNSGRLANPGSTLKRLAVAAPLSMETGQAWNKWQLFRAAQMEVTAIFIIETVFKGRVLEIIPEGRVPTPDLKIKLGKQELLIEVKSQSGQQHGDKHPRSKEWIMFDPQEESNLKSWLFIERTSSRSGLPMKPKVVEAEEKGAQILFSQTDFFSSMNDIARQAAFICPGCRLVGTATVQPLAGKPIIAYFFEGSFPVTEQLDTLREIWLFDESHRERFVVLSQSMYLQEHLANRDNLRLHEGRS